MGDVLIGLGSNLNDREENIRFALDKITAFFRITQLSSFYETEPMHYVWQGWFINAVVSGHFEDDPLELLKLLKEIEFNMGKSPVYEKGPRMIDLDILTFDDLVVSTNELSIPHKFMTERKFVLLPIKEIMPDFIHPASKKHIDDLIADCNDKSIIIKRGHLWKKDKDTGQYDSD